MTRWLGVLAASLLALTPAAVSADSFTPVRMQVKIASVARLHKPLAVTVSVTADQGVLDVRDGPILARVKLSAAECGGVFDYTTGVVLLNRALNPQPQPGRPYHGSTSGSGKPTTYGVQNVCVFLEDAHNQQFESDVTDYQVNVSKPCTTAAAKYDTAARALAKAQARLAHAHGAAARAPLAKLVARRGASAAADRRKARSACGAGVPL